MQRKMEAQPDFRGGQQSMWSKNQERPAGAFGKHI